MRLIIRHIGTFLILLFAGLQLSGQNYIGMHKDKITGVLKQQNPDFRRDNSAVNSTYRYMKFVDDVSEQTMLFFLSDNDICIYVRWMSDYANLKEILNRLNREYKRSGENRWINSDRGNRYVITLEEGEWYFTVNISQE